MASLSLETSPLRAERWPHFDELKGFAITLIVLYHAGGVLAWNNYLHGDIGVDVFIILSGLGLTLGESGRLDAKTFWRRRLSRVLPAYWLILTAYLVCNSHFLQHSVSWPNIALHYTGLHALVGDSYGLAINDSFWFITLIIVLYAFFRLFNPLLNRADDFLLGSGILCCALALGLFFANQPALMGHVAYRLPGFFLGMIAGQLLRSGQMKIPINAKSAAGLFAFAYIPYTRGIFFHPPLVGAALIIGYIFWLRPWLTHAMPAVLAAFAFLGAISLEIFLIHQPLIRDYNYYLHGRWLNVPQPSSLSLITGMAIALLITLLAAVELHRLLARLGPRRSS